MKSAKDIVDKVRRRALLQGDKYTEQDWKDLYTIYDTNIKLNKEYNKKAALEAVGRGMG